MKTLSLLVIGEEVPPEDWWNILESSPCCFRFCKPEAVRDALKSRPQILLFYLLSSNQVAEILQSFWKPKDTLTIAVVPDDTPPSAARQQYPEAHLLLPKEWVTTLLPSLLPSFFSLYTLQKQKNFVEAQRRLFLQHKDRILKSIRSAVNNLDEIEERISQFFHTMVETGAFLTRAHFGAFVQSKGGTTFQIQDWWDGRWHCGRWILPEDQLLPENPPKVQEEVLSVDNLNSILPGFLPWEKTWILKIPFLSRNGTLLGVLILGKSDRPFSVTDRKAAEIYAHHMSLALEYISLNYEQRQHLEQLSKVNALLNEVENQKKQFYRDVVYSATDRKLLLCDREEIEPRPEKVEIVQEIRSAQDIRHLRRQLEDLSHLLPVTEAQKDALLVCGGEAATNALTHAGGGIAYAWTQEDKIILEVEDKGEGIAHTHLPKATLLRGFSTKASLGMGLKLILGLSDRVYLSTSTNGTVIRIEISFQEQPSEVDIEWLLTSNEW